jgi:hypothetical protein
MGGVLLQVNGHTQPSRRWITAVLIALVSAFLPASYGDAEAKSSFELGSDSGETPSDLIHRVFTNDKIYDRQTVEALTHEERDIIKDQLRKWIQGPAQWSNGTPNDWVLRTLVRLDDDWAREFFAKQYCEDPLMKDSAYMNLRDPKLIPYVGDLLLLEDPTPKEWAEQGYMGRQWRVMFAVLDTLGNSAAFPGEVINWARHVAEYQSRDKLAIVREWWNDNNAALKRFDFRRVKAGREP